MFVNAASADREIASPLLAHVGRTDAGAVEMRDLLPGDVIVTHLKKSSNVHRAIQYAQRIQLWVMAAFGSRTARERLAFMDPSAAHVSIYTADRASGTPLQTKPNYLRSAADRGRQFETVQMLRPQARAMPLGDGRHTVYRSSDPEVARQIAQVGKAWMGSEGAPAYNRVDSWLSVLRPSNYGAKARAEFAAAAADAESGDPTLLRARGAFCSSAAVDVLNGAGANVRGAAAGPLLALHGRNATPMELLAAMRASPHFEPVGAMTREKPTYRDLASLEKPKHYDELARGLDGLPTAQARDVFDRLSPKTRRALAPRLDPAVLAQAPV